MTLKDLAKEMDYKTRAGPGGKQLKYIDARQAQDRLDEVCGPQNWEVQYKEIRGELFAGVSILCGDTWVVKWDGGTESNIEKEKGLISDSFKRACVCWGIGRFLYNDTTPTKPQTQPEQDLGNCDKCGAGMKMSRGGKPYCGDTCWKS